jgi:alpha-glucosidase
LRRFIAWRKTQRCLIDGDIHFLDAPEPVLALVRTPADATQGNALLALFNLGHDTMSIELPQAPQTVAVEGHGFTGARREGRRFTLPAYGAYFGKMA